MTRRVEDKVSIITGSTSGLGAATAARFAAEGARVVGGSADYAPDEIVDGESLQRLGYGRADDAGYSAVVGLDRMGTSRCLTLKNRRRKRTCRAPRSSISPSTRAVSISVRSRCHG